MYWYGLGCIFGGVVVVVQLFENWTGTALIHIVEGKTGEIADGSIKLSTLSTLSHEEIYVIATPSWSNTFARCTISVEMFDVNTSYVTLIVSVRQKMMLCR